jgi:predicted DNA repair protein MutK
MKFLSVAGTIAMFSVGGPIVVHGIPPVEKLLRGTGAPAFVADGLFGVLVGIAILLVVKAVSSIARKGRAAA